MLAEVDGNRTRQTGDARLTRFEGGGTHQAPRHLRKQEVSQASAKRPRNPPTNPLGCIAVKKLLILVLLAAVAAVVVKMRSESSDSI